MNEKTLPNARGPVARPPTRPRTRRRGGLAGPLVFVVGILGAVALGVIIGRPVIQAALTDLAEERPGLLRTAAIREFVREGLGDAAERPANAAAPGRSFIVEQGDTAAIVAERLAHQKIISRPIVFLLALFDSGKEESMQAGTYRVSAAMPPD
jgi:hypothetical protein